ncbi:MAG: hypothetical protein AAGA96_10895, partial [Verrucomicrobiota bacterium]
PLKAQMGGQMALLNSPDYEAAAAPLRSAPPRQYTFSKALLSEVMRLMAEDAGIGFFGLPDGTEGADRLVTFTLNSSPFMALETLAKANGISLIYESGIWYLRPANDQELIGRIYEINYNAQELVTKNSQSGGGLSTGSTSSGIGSGSSSGLNLQGSPDFFVTEPSRILEDIENILDIETTGRIATIAPTASVDSVAQLSLAGLQGTPDLVVRPASGEDGSGDAGGSKVIWNSDSNTLYVVATRQQHQWIEAYLASADRPQSMISVEVKFIETRKDPTTDFGIDWDGVLGDNGLEVNLTDGTGPIDLNSIGSYQLPTAVLSYTDLNWKLRALYTDKFAKAVSFPRMVTLDNREVSFRSVVNQPVLGSSASASLGAGATQTSSVEYLPIGTVINILPKRMAGEKILLNVSVTISDIVGTEFINGNPFPIATSRVYTAPLTVKSGYTVAISGLDSATTGETERGVPVLGRIPVIGYAFKNRREERNRQHLMMLITPVALDSGTEGLTKKPITREPWKAPPAGVGHYGKAPVSAGNYPAHPQQAQPINEVPEFDTVEEERKYNHTFGQTGGVSTVAPSEAVLETREVGARVAMPTAVEALTEDELFGGVTRERMTTRSNEIQAVPSPDTTPSIIDSLSPDVSLEDEAPSGTPATPEQPSAVETYTNEKVGGAQTEDLNTSAIQDDTNTDEIGDLREQVASIRKQLGRVPEGEEKLSPDDGQSVVNAYEQARNLLDEVDSKRGEDMKPLKGDLGDVWWDLINLKAQALKLSKRAPKSLAINAGDETPEE